MRPSVNINRLVIKGNDGGVFGSLLPPHSGSAQGKVALMFSKGGSGEGAGPNRKWATGSLGWNEKKEVQVVLPSRTYMMKLIL